MAPPGPQVRGRRRWARTYSAPHTERAPNRSGSGPSGAVSGGGLVRGVLGLSFESVHGPERSVCGSATVLVSPSGAESEGVALHRASPLPQGRVGLHH